MLKKASCEIFSETEPRPHSSWKSKVKSVGGEKQSSDTIDSHRICLKSVLRDAQAGIGWNDRSLVKKKYCCVTEAKLMVCTPETGTVCSIGAIGLVSRSSILTTNFDIWGTSLLFFFCNAVFLFFIVFIILCQFLTYLIQVLLYFSSQKYSVVFHDVEFSFIFAITVFLQYHCVSCCYTHFLLLM